MLLLFVTENELGGNGGLKQEKSPPNHGDEISSAGKFILGYIGNGLLAGL